MVNYTSLAAELVECLCLSADAKFRRNTEDFTHGELRILTLLASNGEGISPGDICEKLGMTTPRISAAVAGLAKKELVTRETDTRDKRRLHVYITEKGRAFVDSKKNELTASLVELLTFLGEDDAREYVRIMGRIREGAVAKNDIG